MLFSGSKFGMVHIGDSRAYLLRDGEFAQITKDDTYVQMLVDEGRITAEEASSHPQRSLLTRALDGRDVDPEYSVRQVVPGDRYLICSDGLSGVVSAETIGDDPAGVRRPAASASSGWSQLALRGGGPDNITVIIADVTDEDIVEATPDRRRRRRPGPGHGHLGRRLDSGRPGLGAAPRRARPRPRSRRPSDDDADRPKRHPVRTAAMAAGPAGDRSAVRRFGRLDVHPVAVLRRRHRRRPGRGLPGRPGSDRRDRPVHRAPTQRHRLDDLTAGRAGHGQGRASGPRASRTPSASSPS